MPVASLLGTIRYFVCRTVGGKGRGHLDLDLWTAKNLHLMAQKL